MGAATNRRAVTAREVMQQVDSDHIELLKHLMARTIDGSATADRRIVDAGPFVGVIHETDDLVWLSYALPWPNAKPEQFSRSHLVTLQKAFREANRVLRFEFFEPVQPWLAGFLATNGLKLQGAQPLMLCGPDNFRPHQTRDVQVRDLTEEASDETLAQFSIVAKLCFGEPPSVEQDEIYRARENLRRQTYRSAYATVRGVMAGIGSISPANDELVGIGTLAPFRRQGVAASISSHLIERQFDAGSPMAWLSAADEAAKAVYQKIGFQMVGMQLNYIEADWDGRTHATTPINS